LADLEAHLSEADLLAHLFPGGGEMGARIRALNWSATLLGPVHGWPPSLRTAVSIMLGSRFPMMVHWGPELVHFYNDGYATILQAKHPGALGEPAEPWWREMWPFLLEIFTPVWAGQTTYFENSLVLPNRQGLVEEAYFTFSHSPIYNEAGAVAGIYVTALETTATVLQHRRLALLSHLSAQAAYAAPTAEAAQHVLAALATNAADIPFALLYTHIPAASEAHLQAWVGLPAGEPLAPATLPVNESPQASWPVAAVLASGQPLLVEHLDARFGELPSGPWSTPPTQALLLPLLAGTTPGSPAIVLVAGLSARRPLDTDYRAFFALVADYAGQALHRATAAYELQRLNQALRTANSALDSFVHIMAHDLKGPALNLRGLLDVYHKEAPGPAREQVLSLLDTAVTQLTSTLQGLLQVLRTQHGAVAETVVFADVLASVRAELASVLRQQHGQLTARFEAAPSVHFPRLYLESILKNLVHNALKYRDPQRGPLVQVQTRPQGAFVELTVTDNGRGMDLPRDRARLFQPFSRLSADGEGTGLGLHMLQNILQQHGGSLDVHSTLGVGSTFTVLLPNEPLT
jgi:signal transduction histidine kinase